MADQPPRCTVCGKPVFPTAPTMFRTARYTTHPRCIRVPKPESVRRKDRAAVGPDAHSDAQVVGADGALNLDAVLAYLGMMLTGIQVLIVAQRGVVGEALQRFFRLLGVIALPATSVEQAMGLVQAVRPELVLCDVSLLAFDDRSLVRHIREHSGGTAPLVLGIGATPVERSIGQSAGLDAFVVKPIGYAELAEALRCAARARADWMEEQQQRMHRRSQSLQAEAARSRAESEVNRLRTQAVITRAKKLAAQAGARSTPFRIGEARVTRPRYRPRLLG
jgi:DNA-binding response OmpR family regulator